MVTDSREEQLTSIDSGDASVAERVPLDERSTLGVYPCNAVVANSSSATNERDASRKPLFPSFSLPPTTRDIQSDMAVCYYCQTAHIVTS